jgi:hypothetical protein
MMKHAVLDGGEHKGDATLKDGDPKTWDQVLH